MGKINGNKLVGKIDYVLYEHCHKDEIVSYWVAKGRLVETAELSIDWDCNQQAMRAYGLPLEALGDHTFLRMGSLGQKYAQIVIQSNQ